MQLKVSIIVPVYNIAAFLPQCLHSIAAQTFGNLEIILVDDGSTDGSGELCDAFAQKDNRVVVIHKQNGGVSSARKVGLDIASGNYLMFVDSDDWIDKDFVCKLVAVAQRDMADCVLCSYTKEYRQGSIESHLFPDDFSYGADDSEKLIHQSLIGPNTHARWYPERIDSLSTTWGKLYTREVAQRGLLVNEREIGYAEDTLFNIFALDGCSQISYVNECLYHYRKYNAASITAGYRPMLAEKYSLFYKYIEDYIAKTGKEHYQQRLLNRIACEMISLGINEINAPVGFSQKVHAIHRLLNRSKYRDAINALETRYCSVKWKFFFLLCKYRQACALTGLLTIIEYLRTRKNRSVTEESI